MQTPNLDQLAKEGARFSQYIATAPICVPSRAGIYTGRMPHTLGVTGQFPIDTDATCLAAYFRQAGYETVLCERMMILNEPGWAGFERILPGADRAASAVEFLEAQTGQPERPFFLSVSFSQVHRPFGETYDPDLVDRLVVPAYLPDLPATRRDLGTLYHQISALDAQIGRILGAIKQAGLAEETIVVFTTEHGPALARAKHTLYDSGIKTALLIKCPARIQAGAKYDQLLSNLDFLPTLLDLSGLSVPKDIHGRSFAALFEQEVDNEVYAGRIEVFSEQSWGRRSGRWYYTPIRAMRTDRYKLIRNFRRQPIYVDNGWLTRFANDKATVEARFSQPLPEVELYDLMADPAELRNLAADPAYEGIKQDLEKRLFQFLTETDDPILAGPIPNRDGHPDGPQWIEDDAGRFHLAPDDPLDPGEVPFT